MPKEDTVGSIMVSRVKSVPPSSTIRNALKVMLENNIGNVLVVDDDGWPSGIITERDVMRLLALDKYSPEIRVDEIMTKPLETVSPGDPIKRALLLMNSRKIRRIPVVKDEKLVGIVTSRDLMRWMLSRGRLKYHDDDLTVEDLQRIFLEW